MAGHADVVEQAVQLADDGRHLLGEVARVHCARRPASPSSAAHALLRWSTAFTLCRVESEWVAAADRRGMRVCRWSCGGANEGIGTIAVLLLEQDPSDAANQTKSDAMLWMAMFNMGAAWWS
jgi:hypothetical protein